MIRAIVSLAALGMICSSVGPAWAGDGHKVERRQTQRTPFFVTAVGQRMPRFVRHRLARRYLCKTLPAFKAEYKSALRNERRNLERNVFQGATNMLFTLLTLASVDPVVYILEKAQTQPLWAGLGVATLAAFYGALNWPWAAERGILAADAAVDTLPWTLKLTDPQETACEVIREAKRNL